MYDVIIVGAGPSGVSSALYAKRANKNVLILYYGESNLEKASLIDNYYGFENGISGIELYETGIKQAKNLEIDVRYEEVLHVEKDINFKVKTNFQEYEGKTLILATGNKKLKPNIKGINEFQGRGISYCAVCDGFFFKNKNIVVIGDGNFALLEAEYLQNIVNNVRILTNGKNFEAESKFEVLTDKIKEIKGDNKVKTIEFENGKTLDIDGIFIAIGEASSADFAKRLGVFTSKNDEIIVNENMATNIDGLYSCGNSTGGLLQVCKSVYEGAEAGLSAINYLNNK